MRNSDNWSQTETVVKIEMDKKDENNQVINKFFPGKLIHNGSELLLSTFWREGSRV